SSTASAGSTSPSTATPTAASSTASRPRTTQARGGSSSSAPRPSPRSAPASRSSRVFAAFRCWCARAPCGAPRITPSSTDPPSTRRSLLHRCLARRPEIVYNPSALVLDILYLSVAILTVYVGLVYLRRAGAAQRTYAWLPLVDGALAGAAAYFGHDSG